MQDDAWVIGAGSAGAATALWLARKGVRVQLIDARPRHAVGASWINGVLPELLRELEVADAPGVVAHTPHAFVMQVGTAGPRATVPTPPVVEVDMAAMTAALLTRCEQAGVTLRFGARVRIGDATPQGREVTCDGETIRIPLVVDAAGLPVGSHAKSLGGRASEAALRDLCSAWQGVFHVNDLAAARGFFEARGLPDDVTLSMAGIEGGYSILNVSLNAEASQVAILTGAMHRDGLRSGAQIARDFVATMPWIAQRLRGAGGLIPLSPLDHTLVEDSLLRVGNAAGQVFPLHGSGVMPGLIAAGLAANAASAALQIGDLSAGQLWPYAWEYQTGHGAICARYQPLRSLSDGLTADEAALLVAAGVVGPDSLRVGLAQEPPVRDPRVVAGVASYAGRFAPLLPRLLRALYLEDRMARHWAAFPRQRPRGPLVWAERADRLLAASRLLQDRTRPALALTDLTDDL